MHSAGRSQWVPTDFIFVMAEVKVKHWKLDEVFNNFTLYFSDMLY